MQASGGGQTVTGIKRDDPPARSSAIPPRPAGWHALGFKVLAGSRLAVVGADADIRRALRSDNEQALRGENPAGEAWRLAARATARIWVFDGNDLFDAVSFPLLDALPIIEQFPDGRWLVAHARSDGRGSSRIVGADGIEHRRIELGDGIEHLKIDNRQRIWVGWFDEGVCGNSRWRFSGHKWAPSAYGIAAFDEGGALVNHAASVGEIMDCYALNVSGDAAWACTYTDFPIWQISDERERIWPTNLSGTTALAVDYPYVLAAGGYEDAANRVVLLRLDHQSVVSLGEWRLPFGGVTPTNLS